MYASIRDGVLLHGWPTIRDGLADLELEAVELELDREMRIRYLDPVDGETHAVLNSPDAIEAYAEHLGEHGIRATALMLGNDFNRDDLDGEISWVTRAVNAAAALAIPAVRIDAIMTGESDMSLDARVMRFTDSMKRVLDATDYRIVELGIENHGHQGNDPDFLDRVLDSVGSDRLGLTLDTGNFYWAGHPLDRVYQIIEHFAPRTKHTHCKNIAYPEETQQIQREVGWRYGDFVCPLADGDIDHARIVRILKEAGYAGDLCIEDESLGRFPKQQWKHVLHKDAEHFHGILSDAGITP